jgi:hypothetical protein
MTDELAQVQVTYIWCLYLAEDLMYKSLFYIRSICNSRQATDTQFEVTRVSAILFIDIRTICTVAITIRLPIHPSVWSNAVWYASYQSLSCSWRSDLDYELLHLPYFEIRLMADVTGRQGMVTPLRHTTSPLVYIQRSVFAPYMYMYSDCISYRTSEIDDCSWFSIELKKKLF